MRINIYTSFNGVGLERDYNILKQIFEQAGHVVGFADWKQKHQRPAHSDIAFHLEIPRYDLIGYAPKNIMIPNPEWFEQRWTNNLNRFQFIFAKTRDCERIFNKYHSNVIFTSFTSLDKFDERISKEKIFVHTAGKSAFKGTNELLQAYNKYDLPKCYMTSQSEYIGKGNIISTGYLSEHDFDVLLNACLIHVCPSYYEGFGHYMWEAMSTGAVVITTNNAPTNEFITDKRFLVEWKTENPHHLGQLRHPSPDDLKRVIQSVDDMPYDTLIAEGYKNRQKFLENDKEFKKTILNLI